MTDLLAPLSPDQTLLLQTMADPYVRTGEWPTWYFVRETLDRQGLDADKLIGSLPQRKLPLSMATYGLAWYPRTGYIQDEEKPALTVAAALHVPSLMAVMAHPFLNVLRKLVEIYRAVPLEPDKVVQATYTAKMIKRAVPSISDQFMARLPEILNHEPPTWGGSKWTEDGEWIRDLGRNISRYAGINDVKSYVARVSELMPEPVAIGAEQVQTGPRLRLPQPVVVRQLPISVSGFYSEPEESAEPEPQPPASVYVDESLIEELEAKHSTTKWSLNKLLQLMRELNSNYAMENPYACHMLLRAILDHVPPVFGVNNFERLASSPPQDWKATDKDYLRQLKNFKPQGHDALHRQIRESADLIKMGYMPPQAWLEALLRLVIDAL
ncbi:hypothetical protein ABT298_07980 [Streptomyces sp. NPDC001034]|uniref:hypothetical protein n=1 Tax=Streptomyces sp. NPDC001034 TaxID=3154375 RepID=UPI00331BD211